MFLSSIAIASLVFKAAVAADVTAVTSCHLHGTQVYCLADATEYLVETTATATSDIAPAYTGCHNHGRDTFCLTPSGDDVQIQLASGISEDEDEDLATNEEPLEENCHFHAGVEHCVGASAEEDRPRSCERKDREYNIPLRIGLLFAILVTSSVAVFSPIFLARFLPSSVGSPIILTLKQFGTGVIISTSLVHLLTHAQLMFANECLGVLTYEATAAAIAMAGLFLSFLVEYLGHRLVKTSSVPSSLMTVYVMEAGVIFHSLIIGLTLVVSGDSFLLTLFAVILFHQMFEGLALGTCIAALGSSRTLPSHHGHGASRPPQGHAAAGIEYDALPTTSPTATTPAGGGFSGAKTKKNAISPDGTMKAVTVSMRQKLSLAAAFGFVTPLGMAIGIGVLDQFNGNDAETIWAIGVLDALSAGILLWVGVVEMWAADWVAAGGAFVEEASWIRTGMGLGALVAGMVAMSVLGKWA
ncbi:hypothetical protein B0T16DRAFT_402728 [Cercophora newfieldiana]|uniref:Uncharacterized protein n=1 Tax=Cercophora newfieldiana TaxID=92897 RepID=A0AA39YSN8_9PEZI|nr:hypothetical protein B0T16DRAFT_402728 [Cercophora newfieldiana]